MKWVLRSLMILHLGFLLYGVYCVLFLEEYVSSSKFILVGITGLFLFVNAFLLLPMTSIYKRLLMILSLTLYGLIVFGFWRVHILKDYSMTLVAFTIYLLLNSLFVRVVKVKKVYEIYGFPLLSLAIVFPFVVLTTSPVALLVSACLLVVLSVYLILKVSRN